MLTDEFATVVAAKRSMLVRIARKILKDTDAAEDAVQQALLHTWAALSDFRGEAHLKTWITRAVINETLMLKRSAKMRRETSDIQRRMYCASAPAGPEQLWSEEETRRLIRREVRCCPRIYRDVLLTDLEAFRDGDTLMSHDRSGRMNINCAKTRRLRARRWLLERMRAHREARAI